MSNRRTMFISPQDLEAVEAEFRLLGFNVKAGARVGDWVSLSYWKPTRDRKRVKQVASGLRAEAAEEFTLEEACAEFNAKADAWLARREKR